MKIIVKAATKQTEPFDMAARKEQTGRLQSALKSMFPATWKSSVVMNSGEGGAIKMLLHNINKNTHVTWHNADIILYLMAHSKDGGNKFLKPTDKVQWNEVAKFGLKNSGVSYRKISGKTIEEITTKLINWLTKNKDAMIKYVDEKISK